MHRGMAPGSGSLRSSRLGERAQKAAGAWGEAWREPSFRIHAIGTPLLLAGTLTLLGHVLAWVERRTTVSPLADPVLEVLTPRDHTWLIFTLIYAGLIAGLVRLLAHPKQMITGVQAYAIMLLLRMLAMYLTPLAPPADMLPLRDPFAEFFTSTSLLTKDLFFSGHTSTMFLLFLGVPGRDVKALFLFCTATVGGAVLWQHVHYSVDVLAAPPFAYLAFHIASRLPKAPGRTA